MLQSTNDRLRIRVLPLLIVVLATYAGSYVILSRKGFAASERLNVDGFYFFPPEDTNAWRRKNYGCVFLFWPLIHIDNLIGTGPAVASEPLWTLS